MRQDQKKRCERKREIKEKKMEEREEIKTLMEERRIEEQETKLEIKECMTKEEIEEETRLKKLTGTYIIKPIIEEEHKSRFSSFFFNSTLVFTVDKDQSVMMKVYNAREELDFFVILNSRHYDYQFDYLCFRTGQYDFIISRAESEKLVFTWCHQDRYYPFALFDTLEMKQSNDKITLNPIKNN